MVNLETKFEGSMDMAMAGPTQMSHQHHRDRYRILKRQLKTLILENDRVRTVCDDDAIRNNILLQKLNNLETDEVNDGDSSDDEQMRRSKRRKVIAITRPGCTTPPPDAKLSSFSCGVRNDQQNILKSAVSTPDLKDKFLIVDKNGIIDTKSPVQLSQSSEIPRIYVPLGDEENTPMEKLK